MAFHAIHSLGHILGMTQEQRRPDRDEYLFIDFDNMVRPKRSSYKINKYAFALKPFDYESIMLYSGKNERIKIDKTKEY